MDQAHIKLIDLVSTQLKKVGSTNGGEYHGPCPFCGGKDRFIVQPEAGRWSCRQCSPSWGDAIAFVMKRDGCNFVAACQQLGLQLHQTAKHTPTIKPQSIRQPSHIPLGEAKHDYPAFSETWQASAHDFTQAAIERLHGRDGERALEYLYQRGLSPMIVQSHNLGYNHEDQNVHWGGVPVWLPRGIVIPWWIDARYWKINIRRPVGDPKYIQAKGGANGLYDADGIVPGCTAVIVEGEFDAMVIRSSMNLAMRNRYRVVATGTATGARLLRWVVKLSQAEKVLLAFDTDKAGVDAAMWWKAALGSKATRLQPSAHDITDMWKAGHDLVQWLQSV